TLRMLGVYTDFAINEGAVPVIPGRKSSTEKFAGANRSYTIEAMMGDTRALQAGTSHNLGQNFARAFEIQYLDTQNQLQLCWTTSWGLSTRFVGAIIMTHGDDQGLVLPPRLAPIQVVIVPIFRSDTERSLVMPVVEQVRGQLSGFRVKVDDRTEVTPGFKFNDWELRGVPLRIEIGPKDVEKGSVAVARRDIPGKAGKAFLPQAELAGKVTGLLAEIQANMLEKARRFRDDHIFDPKDYEELKEVVQNGWAFSWWCGSAECEAKVKEDTKATTRCIPLDQPGGTGRCIVCGDVTKEKIYFARAY
ncbi:MAG TPA: His/Gly/Thr/Pro-type tRNA ligase C-terminal domain-containing protein, partial [Anaerolineaceae bacterium]